MQFIQGSFGQYYNNKHGRQGAFWSKSFALGDQVWLKDVYRREKFKQKK